VARLFVLIAAIAACLATAAFAAGGGGPPAAVRPLVAPSAPRPRRDPPRAQLVADVGRGLDAAEQRWWRNGWFHDPDHDGRPARIWQAVHSLEAAAGLAAATGATADRDRARRYATAAEGYWNPALGGGLGGFSTEYGGRGDTVTNWYDDNGWLGLAFLDAYRATGVRVYLEDARRAFRYLYKSGWDARSGGIWWDSARPFKATESTVTAALLAASLAEETHERSYVVAARRIVDWANANVLDPKSGLYTRVPGSDVAISYLQSPMISAMARLCHTSNLYCKRVGPLIHATLARYGGPLSHAPQYDAMYVRFLLDAYDVTGDARLYKTASKIVFAARRAAASGGGFFLHDWTGGAREVTKLQAHGATLEALAWLAAAKVS
jgi:uncharacterized protein YyaL (SSP411 family)